MKLRIKPGRKIPDVIVTPVRPVQDVKRPLVCTRGKDPSPTGTLRWCHLDIVFLDNGIFLRACDKWKQLGMLIPVKSHAEAQRIAKRFCACRKTGKAPKTCAFEVGWKGELGGKERGAPA